MKKRAWFGVAAGGLGGAVAAFGALFLLYGECRTATDFSLGCRLENLLPTNIGVLLLLGATTGALAAFLLWRGARTRP